MGKIDKQILYEYYRKQKEDALRMYADEARKHKQKLRLEVIREMLQSSNPSAGKILDVGCGDGYAAQYVLNGITYETYTGVDLSPMKLQAVLCRVNRARVIIADAEILPFQSESFDYILCLETLEHLLAPQITLTEIESVLKQCGVCIISIPIDSKLQEIWKKVRNSFFRKRNLEFHEHIQIVTKQRIKQIIADSNFEVIENRFCCFSLPLAGFLTRHMPYQIFKFIDYWLCKIPMQCFGIGVAAFGISLGREYLVMLLRKHRTRGRD